MVRNVQNNKIKILNILKNNNMKILFLSQVPMDTSNYIPVLTTTFGSNDAIQSAFDWIYGANGFSDEEMLATMQAIKNPTWWSNMMMPG